MSHEYVIRIPAASAAVISGLQEQLQTTLGDDFRLDRELGGGGMSRVFLAEETRLGRRVVIKVLSPELAGLSTDRFEREIRFAAALQDPHIVPVLQAGHSADIQYYVMPYIDGETLRARLARGPLPLEAALAILRDVALALEYAHAHRIVHRDIKPENILLTGRTAVVADFGIAKAIAEAAPAASGDALTGLGTIVGTPAYMAPEQAAGGDVDSRADLYAWGVIAYEMLAGAHPFAGHSSPQALLAAHVTERPVPLGDRRPDLAVTLAPLVDRCLAKDPAQRPRDGAALVAELQAHAVLGTTRRVPAAFAVPAGIALALLIGLGAWAYRGSEQRHWARDRAIAEAQTLRDATHFLAAFLLLQKAQRYVPADSQIARAIEDNAQLASFPHLPAGAGVAIQDYLASDSTWYPLGTAPLAKIRVPRGYFRWRVSRPGAADYLVAQPSRPAIDFGLDSAPAAPDGMVPVRADRWGGMIAFVGWMGPYNLPAFYIDRFEVTNREYQRFVDQGGYQTPKYWNERFIDGGHELTRDQAMIRFRDRTGRAGPSTWEGGHYPDGQANYPVSGVSWYEASAYAAFAGKTLPVFAQWYLVAPNNVGQFIVRTSNIAGSGLAPVGTFKGLGPAGTYDMAGNVREWITNAVDADRRFILGGAWNSQTYIYADPEALSPFDRSATNGFRCVRNLGPLPEATTKPIKPFERDFSKAKPANDEVFRAYRVMYAYDSIPLNATVEAIAQEGKDWRKEKITFDAAYGGERMSAYLFLPKRVRPPFQTIVFFPSARVFDLPDSRDLGDTAFFDYVVQSGRAVMYPVFQDTYERRILRQRPGASQAIALKVQRSKDLGRTIDYLQTRPDVARDKLAYLGVSMGAAEGVIYMALAQDRFGAVVFLDGGFFLDPPKRGGDQADFAPRIKKPVLMVNGRYDFTFSLERAQTPLFQMLGTPSADKRHVVLETPHDVRADRTTLVKEVLGWLDRYLGRVDEPTATGKR